MSKVIKFSVGEESYHGLIYEECDLYGHVKLRIEHHMNDEHGDKTSPPFNFAKIEEHHISIEKIHSRYLYDIILFIDDNFNIKVLKNTYLFKDDVISEILFSQI